MRTPPKPRSAGSTGVATAAFTGVSVGEAGTGSIKSADRVLQILNLVSRHPDGLAAQDIRTQLGLPKSSLHGLLRVLCDGGYLFSDPDTRIYRIGLRAWEVGQAYSQTRNLTILVGPVMRELRDELNETVQLAILDGLENVYLAKEDSDHPLRLVSGVGLRLPAHTTALGKVLLAGLPAEELKRRLAGVTLQRFTTKTISDKSELLRRLAAVRTNGFAEDDGEYTVGLFCVAVPVRSAGGSVLAAISCSIPSARAGMGADRAQQYLPALRACAARLAVLMAPHEDRTDGLEG